MRAPAFSLRHKLISFCAAVLLACGFAPFAAFAQESVAASFVLAASEGNGEAATPNSPNEQQQVSASQDANDLRVAPMLASGLFGAPISFVSSDVALDAVDPLVGSFTVDGLTYALNNGNATLVAVSSDLQRVTNSQNADDSRVAPVLAPGQVAIPASVTYNGTAYDVTAIGPYAFYLSGATDVALPASVSSVDDRAFRSSDVERVTVDPANPNLISFDGALYSADESRLLLIPEGRKGSVLLSCETEVVQASLFSHCSLVGAISVEEGGAAFSSWDGLLYDASGTTLLRVPAGATEITVRDGCTTIAAGALEGCANLERINAPASVTSISPDVFTSVPTVSLPATSVSGGSQQVMDPQDESDSRVAPMLASGQADGSAQAEGEAEVAPRRVVASSQGLEAPLALPDLGSTSASPSSEASGAAPQLTAMVALSVVDNGIPEISPSSIEVSPSGGADVSLWRTAGFSAVPIASSQVAMTLKESASASSQFLGPEGTVIIRAISPYAPWDSRYEGDAVSVWQQTGTNGAGLLPSYTYTPYVLDGKSYQLFAGSGARDFILYEGVLVSKNTYWSFSGYSGPLGYAYELYMPTSLSGRFADGELSYSGVPMASGWQSDVPNGTNAWDSPSYDFVVGSSLAPDKVTLTFSANEGAWADGSQSKQVSSYVNSTTTAPEAPSREGYDFLGWTTNADGSEPAGGYMAAGASIAVFGDATYYAAWKEQGFNIGFDTSSEPGDEDYPGGAVDDKFVKPDDGQVPIEDPKRPGYVFEGWVIPSADGTEAIDQELVHQGDDGKWYVDASKLPDYADSDGKVELTARWTSIISVDVPSSVTFYADLVTQGQESREGAAEGAFGQSKVENQSEIDLRIVGLDSNAVKTEGSTLGADSILKKADAATPSTSTQKLLSLYPSIKAWTADELRDPDAVGGDKATTAVDFDLDDILLEKSFAADDFTIAAGGTLNMGYRLNLSETGQQLDYDKLSTLEEGQSASIANVSYTFAGDILPSDCDDPLWIENPDRTSNPAKYLLLKDIREAANDLSANGTSSRYYSLYKSLLDAQATDNGNPGAGPYFQLKVDGVYLPLQLIGICQDTRSDNGKPAGLTFQMRDIYAYDSMRSTAAGGGAFDCRMNMSPTNSGGWSSSAMRLTLRSTFWGYLPERMQAAIVGVDKFQQLPGSATDASGLDKTVGETIWLPSAYEVYGNASRNLNESEGLTNVSGYAPFQYMAYEGNSGSFSKQPKAGKTHNGSAAAWWMRTADRPSLVNFPLVSSGIIDYSYASSAYGVAPAFCL